MSKLRVFSLIFTITLVVGLNTPAFGQWTTQEITLQPGWNAVFLEVHPEPDD